MKVCSLFSGIGGFEVALGGRFFELALMCESSPEARSILKRRFEGVRLSKDIVDLNVLPPCDLVTAGWPCQDLSQAGGVAGHSGKQSGLVEHVFRLLNASAKKPQFVLLENVAFALHLHQGLAIKQVVSSLEALGYSWAFRVLDSQEFGLPQRRRRIYILASLDFDPSAILLQAPNNSATASPDANMYGFYWTEGNRGTGWTPEGVPPLKGGSSFSIPSPPAIWNKHRRTFFTPGIIDAERLQGFPPNWTSLGNDAGNERGRWRMVGNAVSIPVVKWIGMRIKHQVQTSASVEQFAPELESTKTLNAAYKIRGKRAVKGFLEEAPAQRVRQKLSEFDLREPQPLSRRAASGFYKRYAKSTLKKNSNFLEDLARYCGPTI